MSAPPAAPRTYKGVSLEDRKTERRERLIDAAIQVYGEQGYRNASVKIVCQAAGLTERYFYESFENSEALFIAAYNKVTFGLVKDLQLTASAHAASPQGYARALLTAYFTTLQAQPAAAKVFLLEFRGASPQLDETFNASLRAIALMALQILGLPESDHNRLLATGVIAGITQIAAEWIKQGHTPDIAAITDACMALGANFFQQA